MGSNEEKKSERKKKLINWKFVVSSTLSLKSVNVAELLSRLYFSRQLSRDSDFNHFTFGGETLIITI